MVNISNSMVQWFFEKAANILDAVTDSYSDQEAEQAISWALEDAFIQGVQYGRNNPIKND